MWRWFVASLGRARAWFARRAGTLQSQAEAQRRQIEAEVRLLGAEVAVLGAAFWEPIDAWRFVPERLRFAAVRTQYYGHGAFMGAAPSLLADPTWRRILAFLMPDVFQAVKARLDEDADAGRLMPMLENNPVLAAYGTLHAARASGAAEHPNHLAGMEWDLFVDEDLISAWEAAGSEEERSKVMDRVIDTSLIAHANAIDTVQESLGVSQYADVRRTPKTAYGGVEMDAWIDLFGRALTLAQAPAFEAAVEAMAGDPRRSSEEACLLHTFARPWPVERVVDLYRQVTGRPFLSIIIDIKSLRSTPPFLSALVRHLNRFGVHVAAVGSFLADEIRGVGDQAQEVAGQVAPGPREVLFFHFAGDLQAACEEGLLRPGQHVMFNGASLLDCVTTEGGRHVYSARLRVLRELEEWRERLDLHVGFYVQEGDCEAAAAGVLSDVVDAWPSTFSLGFAWGGLRDEAGLPAGERARLGYGSQRLLEHVGKARQWRLGEKA